MAKSITISNIAIQAGNEYSYARIRYAKGESVTEEQLLRAFVRVPGAPTLRLLNLEGYSLIQNGYPNVTGEYGFRIRRTMDARRMVRQGTVSASRVW